MIKPAGLAIVYVRGAVSLFAAVRRAENVLFRRPLAVVAHEKVEPPVLVIIPPYGRAAPGRLVVYACSLRNFAESAFFIAVQAAGTEHASNVKILPAVVIVIPRVGSHPVQLDLEAGFFGHVRKRTVPVIAEEGHET